MKLSEVAPGGHFIWGSIEYVMLGKGSINCTVAPASDRFADIRLPSNSAVQPVGTEYSPASEGRETFDIGPRGFK